VDCPPWPSLGVLSAASLFLLEGAEYSSALSGGPDGGECLRLRVVGTGGLEVLAALRFSDGRLKATEDFDTDAEASDSCFFGFPVLFRM
jgi:hypothetical protein